MIVHTSSKQQRCSSGDAQTETEGLGRRRGMLAQRARHTTAHSACAVSCDLSRSAVPLATFKFAMSTRDEPAEGALAPAGALETCGSAQLRPILLSFVQQLGGTQFLWHWAAAGGDPGLVRTLADMGLPIEAGEQPIGEEVLERIFGHKDTQGRIALTCGTALAAAAYLGAQAVVAALLAAGADPEPAGRAILNTPLEALARGCESRPEEDVMATAKHLIAAGAHTSHFRNSGTLSCCAMACAPLAHLLLAQLQQGLQAGSFQPGPFFNGWGGPLRAAALVDASECFLCLLARVSLDSNGTRMLTEALAYAACRGGLQVLQLQLALQPTVATAVALLAAGAAPARATTAAELLHSAARGMEPAMMESAALRPQPEAVQMLLGGGTL